MNNNQGEHEHHQKQVKQAKMFPSFTYCRTAGSEASREEKLQIKVAWCEVNFHQINLQIK